METIHFFNVMDLKNLIKTKIQAPDINIHIKIDLSKLSFFDRLFGKKIEVIGAVSVEVDDH